MPAKKFSLTFEIVPSSSTDLNATYWHATCGPKLNIFYIYYVKHIVKEALNDLLVSIGIK